MLSVGEELVMMRVRDSFQCGGLPLCLGFGLQLSVVKVKMMG